MEELREEIAKRLFMDDVRAEEGDISWRNASVAVRGLYMMRAIPFLDLLERERYVKLTEDQSVPERVKGFIAGGLYPGYRAGVEDMLKAGFRRVELSRGKCEW